MSTEHSDLVPDANIANLKNQSFSAVHLYAETFNPAYPNGTGNGRTPGYAAAWLDNAVARTKAANVYLIIVLANGDNNVKYNLAYARDFWTVYAARYKDESPGAVSINVDCYKIIRAAAPNTPVLMFTYASLGGGASAAGAVADAQAFSKAVFRNANAKWTNEAIAITDSTDAVTALNKAGYSVVLTEFANTTGACSNRSQHTDLTNGPSGDITDPTVYANRMKAANISFAADPGTR
ncbi:glycoside hydrolase family 5 protein [Gonapodya prolifera JEL478]|uniref:Glycoside hydrolase family 5 protein n=1 Tax=Gonapodya prolifera (strain JEL478) TaxID=1344416 RepID=A0A139ACR3_GONPJ|nr:glycoside hydrolase family 5 protein [Gonapodya prolifera JEL478]|eukprot:KXS14459.1 glycoside hydrolase family 5 protein [Gonapodya prolifera JEL478]